MTTYSATELDFAQKLLSAICTDSPSFAAVLSAACEFQKADHYALLESPAVVPYHFTLCSDVLGLRVNGPKLETKSGEAEIVESSDPQQFVGLTEIQSILTVPVSEDLIVIFTNPQNRIVSKFVIDRLVYSIRDVYAKTAVDINFSIKTVNAYDNAKMKELSRRSFSVTNYHPSEIFLNVFAMFVRSGISARVGIDPVKLLKFMVDLRRHYNPVPYHNWFHALDVTQFVFSVISNGNVDNYLEDIEVFGLLLSAICHDTDHNGMNNNFHRNAKTVLAHLAHGTLPPLEHHHSCMTMDLAKDLLATFSESDRLRVSRFIVDCIMATDMEQHKQFLTNFGAIESGFDKQNTEQRRLLAQIILKAADLSNTVRDFEEAARMSAKLTEECHRQGDKEVELGLPISPMCNRGDTTPMCVGQIGFYKFVAGPLMKELHAFFPELKENEQQYESNLARWEKMKQEWEESKNV